jgi:hypothetical protein
MPNNNISFPFFSPIKIEKRIGAEKALDTNRNRGSLCLGDFTFLYLLK